MGNHSWTNYVQAAYKGVFEYLKTHEPAKMPQNLVGLNLVIEGQVPQGEASLYSSITNGAMVPFLDRVANAGGTLNLIWQSVFAVPVEPNRILHNLEHARRYSCHRPCRVLQPLLV